MKTTLSTDEAARCLLADEFANWTAAGAHALVAHLEALEEEIELDRVALRCDFSEYASLFDWVSAYTGREIITGLDILGLGAYHDTTTDDNVREYIQERGELVEFQGGVIVSSF